MRERPSVFVGSSTEGLPAAKAIQVALDHACEARLWSQGVFGLSQGTLEALVAGASQFDYAILVLTPDDLVDSRGSQRTAARDNVLFELGLFMGVLGPRRTFIVFDRTADIRLPSDLAGVTCATYEPHGSGQPGGLRASLGAPCALIEEAMDAQGLRVKAADIVDYQNTIRKLQDQLRGRRASVSPLLVEGGLLRRQRKNSGVGDILIAPFLIDVFPVTNQEFGRFITESEEWNAAGIYKKYGIPYYLCDFRGNVAPEDKWDHPVVWVNWYAAAAFCNWRSTTEGRGAVYVFRSPTDVGSDLTLDGWRLPTEAEWEIAARAGTETEDPWNGDVNPTQANYGHCYRETTSVGRFEPNALGIFDMLGNVKEWCHDWYSDKRPSARVRNPSGPFTGRFKIFRGASFMDGKELLRFAQRGKLPPENTNPDFGFRCVRRPGITSEPTRGTSRRRR
jgi:formylglycine-generating enzyme required for sulfatase activity